jgi:micrococcal nuclease
MKWLLLILLLCTQAHSEDFFVQVLDSVYDGDTFTIDIPELPGVFGSRLPVRVAGIDCPEMRTHNLCEKKKAMQAKALVQRLLKNAHSIQLKNVKRDKYFRLLATVEIDGVPLANTLLSQKLAYKYSGGPKEKRNWCD